MLWTTVGFITLFLLIGMVAYFKATPEIKKLLLWTLICGLTATILLPSGVMAMDAGHKEIGLSLAGTSILFLLVASILGTIASVKAKNATGKALMITMITITVIIIASLFLESYVTYEDYRSGSHLKINPQPSAILRAPSGSESAQEQLSSLQRGSSMF